MPWVCPICSTNNEESDSRCIVCDTERVLNKICTLTYTRVQKLGLSGNVIIPKEFNVIGESAFKGRNDIYSVTIHSNVRKIAKEAFSGCANLKSIVCGHELETVGIKAFADCTSLQPSDRVNAEYVAEDAYYITPKPQPRPVSPIPSKYDTGEICWKKRMAQIVLFALAALLLLPIINWFLSFFQSGVEFGYSMFIGVALFLLLIVSVYFRYTDMSWKAFFKEVKVIPAIVILLVLYAVYVVWGEILRWTVVFFGLALLIGELIFLGKSVYKKKYKFISLLIFLIIINSILLWRVIG